MMKVTILFLTVLILSSAWSQVNAGQSKRVEVYSTSQSFWDVIPGETLGDIVKQLLPDNPGLREKLLYQIVELNPDAFSQSNPDNLKANIRLWLPNNAQAMRKVKDKSKYEVKSFSWGQVYKAKRN